MLKKILIGSTTFALAFVVSIPFDADANNLKHFGGKVTDKTSCTCSWSTKITTDGFGADTYLVVPGSIYDNDGVEDGENVVGQAYPTPVPCLYLVVTIVPPTATCEIRGYAKPVDKIGSS